MDVSTKIIHAFLGFYAEEVRARKQQEETDKKNFEKMLRYGIKMRHERMKGVAPAYYRSLEGRLEMATAIMYDHSRPFREAIKRTHIEVQSTDRNLKEKQTTRIRNRIATNQMQHPEYLGYRKKIDVFDYLSVKWNPLEQGKTYAWHLDLKYGGEEGFANKATHGKCMSCKKDLPVWRTCEICAYLYMKFCGKDIYTRCLGCPLAMHQRELVMTRNCEDCRGPPELKASFYK